MKLKAFFSIFLLLVISQIHAQVYVSHPWAGKKVAYLGDSITDPRNSGSDNKYWNLLNEWLGITPYVYAVSGRQWNDIPRQADKLRSEHGDGFDAIIIFIGTNDYNNAVPLGRWYDEVAETVEYGHGYAKRPETRMRRIPVMDDSTFRGRMNIALDSMKRTFPEKQIVLLTPIHRAGFHANEKNWQIAEDYANRCGEYLDAYITAVKECGQVWAVPVIDLSALCGLYPMLDEHAEYFANPDKDRLHPNNDGHRRMAATMMYQLLTIPCSF
ncbi:MAG: SGNH/GDSL hydrolase family protein [Bacteroidales bacterium]|nr:SGNH/GDSL hydrolase family protein [Bacteroidales bacterium]MCM1147573.1 SGNH/GDSL hydrolase family protein [Bacteroidales bacterium]MCM1206363.1 SGNH/GDSL hydrolase family protein [Bacillota bacterium]MCM1509097.1 SGNH/GDSL hydrolase family protein [Clostridium sp.]